MLTILEFTYKQPKQGAAKMATTAMFLNNFGQFIRNYYIKLRLTFLNISQFHNYKNYKSMFRKLGLALLSTTASVSYFMDESKAPQSTRNAICILYPNNSNVRGVVSFSQQNATTPVKIACSVKGLNPNSKHGIHIHEFGDLTDGCTTAGPHYNPLGKNHGGPFEKQRHVGDLGNLVSDPFGNSYMCFKDDIVSLFGNWSIVGRSVVVHAKEDDLGKKGDEQSLKTGNSGARVACGVIGLSKQFKSLNPNENI